MKTPHIPVSWGELFDKKTILHIKLKNLKTKSALKNVKTEYDELSKIFDKNFSKNTNAKKLLSDLQKINQKLWEIEDLIRDKERNKTFDKEFIKLARSVYFTNDDRARIKRIVNDTLGSEIIEEKSYSDY